MTFFPGEARQRLDEARRHLDPRELVVAPGELVEPRRESIGDERDRSAVRGPRGLQVGERVVGERLEPRFREVVDEEVSEAAADRREREPRPVRRPRRVEHLLEVAQRDLARDLAALDVEDREHRPAPAHGGEGEPAAVRVPGARGADELEAVEVRVQTPIEDPPLHTAALCIGQEQLERSFLPLGQEHDTASVRAESGREVERPRRPAGDEHAAEALRRPFGTAVRRVRLVQGLVPLLRQLRLGDLERLLDHFQRRLARARDVLEDAADRLVAPPPGYVGPERVSVAIGEIARVTEAADARQAAVARRVAHPHRGVRVVRAQREVFGHAFDEPERQAERAAVPASEHVELERVDQLVTENVVRLRERTGRGQHDAALQDLGDAARRLAQLAVDRVGLLEVRMPRVQDDRLPALELVVEEDAQPRVPALGETRDDPRRGLLRRIEVDVEVIRPQDLELERLVAHLVAAEVLGLGGGWPGGEH